MQAWRKVTAKHSATGNVSARKWAAFRRSIGRGVGGWTLGRIASIMNLQRVDRFVAGSE